MENFEIPEIRLNNQNTIKRQLRKHQTLASFSKDLKDFDQKPRTSLIGNFIRE